MEIILPKRIKYLILAILIPVLIGVFLILLQSNLYRPNRTDQAVQQNLSRIERVLLNRMTQAEDRCQKIYSLFTGDRIQHLDLEDREALIQLDNGKIIRHFGEIYQFKKEDIPVGDWVFMEKGNGIYFMKKLEADLFYVKFFLDISENFVINRLEFPYTTSVLKFLSPGFSRTQQISQTQRTDQTFFYTYLLNHSNNQLVLELKLSVARLKEFYLKRRIVITLLLILIFSLLALLLLRRMPGTLSPLLSHGLPPLIFTIFFLLSRQLNWRDSHFNLTGFTLFSVLELFVISLFILYLVNRYFRSNTNLPVNLFFYDLLTLAVLLLAQKIMGSVSFFYATFNMNGSYLVLLLTLFSLHLIPVFLLRKLMLEARLKEILKLLILQAAFFLLVILFLPGRRAVLINLGMFTLIFFLLIFFRRDFLLKGLILFLVSLVIFFVLHNGSVSIKQDFIATNLKDIFLNQDNYAKFVAREIALHIQPTEGRFSEFFQPQRKQELEKIWRSSIASNENIASGIFVVSKDGQIVNQFSSQIPFIDVEGFKVFPVWAVEDAGATLYGREVTLALATLSVEMDGENIGFIMVQVLSSPELILRDQDETNIFTIDRRVGGLDLSYIKLNQGNRIVENPSNLNLENLSGLTTGNDEWIEFKFMELNLNGFVFQGEDNTVIIFYPEKNLLKNFSEIIKIFLFLLLLTIPFNYKGITGLSWANMYYSYSVRVFTILILISLFTANIFSIFSLNYHSQFSEAEFRQTVYERGRTAQNIVQNMVETQGELTQDHLFLLSKLLEIDVNAYENGQFLYTSNYQKVLNSEIPSHLHSHIVDLLEQKNQRFELQGDRGMFHLYFKLSDYIIDIEYPYQRFDLSTAKGSYGDFIIALFFILMIIGFYSAYVFRNKILSPIFGLNRGMAEVEKGNLSTLTQIPREIELKNLYLGFNAMVGGIREQKKNISEISRMKTLVKLGRRVAHEVKNPLTPIKLSAEQILRSLKGQGKNDEAVIKQSIRFIIDATDHLKKVSYGFLDLSRLDEIEAEHFDLLELMREEIAILVQLYPAIDFVVHCEKKCFLVRLDKIKISQVLKNLIINSIEAIEAKEGRIEIKLDEDNGWARLEIRDNGVGMDEQELQLIFKDEYSSKEVGSGLGLFIVKRIIELHGGRIDVQSDKGAGTCVTVRLKKDVFETG